MTYLLDANTLIRSANHDFPMDQNPSFWEWVLEMGRQKTIAMPTNIYDEVRNGSDKLSEWVKTYKDSLNILYSEEALNELPFVLSAYGPSIQDKDLEKIESDAILISYARHYKSIIVTYETRNNATTPSNKKIPSICHDLNVNCISLPNFLWRIFNPNAKF